MAAKTEIERRAVVPTRVEVRAEGDPSVPTTLYGMAARYNSPTNIMGLFIESIAPGAFDDVLDDDVRCLFNHSDDQILGRTKAGTLRLIPTDDGLEYECLLPASPLGQTVGVAVQRGDVSTSSFQFTVEGDIWAYPDDGSLPNRTITKVGRLYDVAPTTFAAYETTSVSARAEARSKSPEPIAVPEPPAVEAPQPDLRAATEAARAALDLVVATYR